MLTIRRKIELIEAMEAIERRCEVMLRAGMSYKAIADEKDGLGLSHSEIARIRRKCGVSAWEYRNGKGPLGSIVRDKIVLLPVENVKGLVRLFADMTPKQLQ